MPFDYFLMATVIYIHSKGFIGKPNLTFKKKDMSTGKMKGTEILFAKRYSITGLEHEPCPFSPGGEY